jgi:glucose/arabinose dehydrogenase
MSPPARRTTRVLATAVLVTAGSTLAPGSTLTPGSTLAPAVASPVRAAVTAVAAVAAVTAPRLRVAMVVGGLAHPWDVAFTPDRTMLFTERGGRLSARSPRGAVKRVRADFSDLFVGGETGLMGLTVDPRFSANRRIYTCQGHDGAVRDIRVVAWRVNRGYTAARRIGTVVRGLPVTSGRHGGCRLRIDPGGYLRVGTGDAATGTNPQNLRSLGGKTLRVRRNGSVPPDNPFAASPDRRTRLIYTYGHRNVQGLARRLGTRQMWSVEHGPSSHDEVNVLLPGANYGWNPVPGYDESVPMTDLRRYPRAVRARWTSGNGVIAPSGATFLAGSGWGRWQGALAVAALRGSRLTVFTLGPRSRIVRAEVVPALDQRYGRLRCAQLGPDRSLYVTTDNGSGDRILRITPRA